MKKEFYPSAIAIAPCIPAYRQPSGNATGQVHPCTHRIKVYKPAPPYAGVPIILLLISCAILHTVYTFSQGQGQGLWNAIGQDGVTTNRQVSIKGTTPQADFDINGTMKVRSNAIFDTSLTARSLYSYYLSVSDNTSINWLSVGGDARFYRNTYIDSLLTANEIRAQLLGAGIIIGDSAQLELVISSFINAAQINGIDISSTKITAERINTDTVVTVVLSCGNAKFTGTVLASDISTGALTVTGTSTLHKIIVSDGVTVTSLAGNGQGLIQYDTTGKLTQLDFTNDSNAVLTGSGTFRSINTLVPPDTGWQWVGSDLITTANDVYIPNSLNVGKTISIGPFKIKNGGTRDTIRTAAALAIISDAQNINLEADTVRMPNYVEAPNIRSSQLQVSGDAIISNNLSVGGYMSIGTGTKMISNGSYRDTLRTAKELSVISDANLINLEADTVRMTQLVEAGKVNTPIGNIDSLTSDKIRTARLSVSGDIEALNGTVRSNEVSTTTITTNTLNISAQLSSPRVVTSRISSPDSILSLGDSTIKFNDTYNYMYTENEALRIFAIGTTGNPPQNLMLQTAVGSGNTIIGSTVGIASFTPAQDALLDIRNNQFQVNIYGNLVRINGVSYSWPSMNVGTGSILTNDGTGTLSWSTPGSLSSALSSDLWSLTGNSGTTAGTNFIGTTDAADLVFKTNNFERMIIENVNGNVGIGTTSPGRPLSIQGSGQHHQLLEFRDNTGTTKWHWNLLGSTGLNLAETDMADARLFIKNGGNIGIGTSEPHHKFDVNGHIGLVDHLIFNGTSTDGVINWPEGKGLWFRTNSTPGDVNTYMTRMIIKGDEEGNVGIGTENPEKKVHIVTEHFYQDVEMHPCFTDPTLCPLEGVTPDIPPELSHEGIRLEDRSTFRYGTVKTTIWDIEPRNQNLLIRPKNAFAPWMANVGIDLNVAMYKLDVNGSIHNGGADFILGKYDGRNQGTKKANRALVHDGYQAGEDNLVINYEGDFEDGVFIAGPKAIVAGDLGVGTNTIPTGYKMAVNGNIIAVDVMIKEYSEWPDYVLKPGHKRMTFEEQARYYLKNNHLDGLPSAEEIAKGNTGVSTLLIGITKNLEETRLDAIDLNNEIIGLRAELKKRDKIIADLLQRMEELEKRK